ncbi:hypothetical protein AX16_008862 [Volvariella volvacea WC 439]|nr:hypothetical protein AX16_008862 [Volvariella volvacea WC 439]
MGPVRLRHPNGIATIQVPFDREDYAVGDLLQQIYAETKILPSRQTLKAGYPPQPLTVIPELPLSSLGLKSGEQIIVSESSDRSASSLVAQPPVSSAAIQPPASSHSQPPAPTLSRPAGPDFVETDTGFLVHRVVPDDNSCLFSAVALIFEQSIAKAPQMRQIVADGIKNDPETYNEAILGMPPTGYISTILKPSTWGGAIELGILAAHYDIEIASIDVETGRIDHFSPPSGAFSSRCILLYSGIHYDAVSLAPSIDSPSEWHQTIFPVASTNDSSDPIVVAASQLATTLRAKKAYTNTATFDLKCEICGKGLKGEKEARSHAEQTGHTRFGEY